MLFWGSSVVIVTKGVLVMMGFGCAWCVSGSWVAKGVTNLGMEKAIAMGLKTGNGCWVCIENGRVVVSGLLGFCYY